MANIYNIRNLETYKNQVARKDKKMRQARSRLEALTEKIEKLKAEHVKAELALQDVARIRASHDVVEAALKYGATKVGVKEGERWEAMTYFVNGVWCKLVCVCDEKGEPTKNEKGEYIQTMKPVEA